MTGKHPLEIDDNTRNAVSVGNAFTAQAPLFDQIQHSSMMLTWMRSEVHRHMMKFLSPGDTILDINAGTGIDAVFFAEQGHTVYAMDIAEGMVSEIKKKITANHLEQRITAERRSFMEAAALAPKQFDHIFSNFGGLNCTNNLPAVVRQLTAVIKPGGLITLVVMPPVCPWELLRLFTGEYSLAFRRLRRNGITAHIEGEYFTTYYHPVGKILKSFGKDFKLISVKGIASFSPPPFMEKFPQVFPRIYSFLQLLDEKFSSYPPFNRWADQCMITMRYLP